MRTVVYKYQIKAERGPQMVEVHGLPNIVHFGHDPSGVLSIWAEVDPAHREGQRSFIMAYTGEDIPSQSYHVGTCLHDGLVLHLYTFGWRGRRS